MPKHAISGAILFLALERQCEPTSVDDYLNILPIVYFRHDKIEEYEEKNIIMAHSQKR